MAFCFLLNHWVTAIYSQDDQRWQCAEERLEALHRKADKRYEQKQQASNQQISDYIRSAVSNGKSPWPGMKRGGDSVYTIPVVVHIIHRSGEAYGTGTNISYAQIRSQLEALNAAFSKSYTAYNGQSHPAYAQDARIRFCLAQNTMPASAGWSRGPGGLEYGVKRYADNAGLVNHMMSTASANQLKSLTHPTVNHFPFDKYLNIWVVGKIEDGTVMGYAPKPINAAYPIDGVVMRADIFGDNSAGGNFPLSFGLTEGKILAHEVGHYLNLYHIFQGGCAGRNPRGAATDACDLNGDFICDTKPATTQNTACTNTYPSTCEANYVTGTVDHDMLNNYMSYADDDCMNTFTKDQVDRMWATLHLQRFTLWQYENLAATGVLGTNGCIPPYLNAAISTKSPAYCSGRSIEFSNPPAGNTANSYEWSFPGGIPATANGPTTTTTYNTPGRYTVFLTVSDGVNTRKDSLPINVLGCEVDSSLLNRSHWFFGNFCSVDFSEGTALQTLTALDNNSMQAELAYPEQPMAYGNAVVSVSDSSGDLLFYSNGVSVWNKKHQKISRASLFGKSDINAATGFSYVPYPGQKDKYFLVGASPQIHQLNQGIRFVMVDLAADTVSAYREFRHPALPKQFSQFLTIIPHCNGEDYWTVAKGYGLGDTRFYSFLVTSSGIDSDQQPIISSRFNHPAFQGGGNQMKANRYGNKIILSSPHGYEGAPSGALYDFDSRTGEVKNEKIIPNVTGYSNIQSGAAFSPNSEYFYLMRSSNFETNGPPYWLFQYRVSDLQYNVYAAPGFYYGASYQLGPDNNIYIAAGHNWLARIGNTDKWGEATLDGSFLRVSDKNNRIMSIGSLPSFIDAQHPKPEKPDFSINSTSCSMYSFSILCYDNFIATWNFGDGSEQAIGNAVTHRFVNPGTYTVTLTMSKHAVTYGSVSKTVVVADTAINITGPASTCDSDRFPSQYFASSLPGMSYKWTVVNGNLRGADNLSFAAVSWQGDKSEGKIRLEISRDLCKIVAEKNIAINQAPEISWQLAKEVVCLQDSAIRLMAPGNGSFAGKGVVGNNFFPAIAGTGIHPIAYVYPGDDASCPVHPVVKSIEVKDCYVPPVGNCFELFDDYTVFINGATHELEIKTSYPFRKVQVYNLLGQMIAAGQPVNNKLQLPSLKQGVYIAVIYCEEQGYWRSFKLFKL